MVKLQRAYGGCLWRHETMKGVASCDKPRGAASRLRSGDAPMGKPILSYIRISAAEYIGSKRLTRGSETSQYPQEEKANAISLVVASEREIA